MHIHTQHTYAHAHIQTHTYIAHTTHIHTCTHTTHIHTCTHTNTFTQPERLQGAEYSILSDIWSLGISLVEMALGRYPIPAPPLGEIDLEMTQPPAGHLPPRQGGNPYASHANAIRMPVFELLQVIFTGVSTALVVDG